MTSACFVFGGRAAAAPTKSAAAPTKSYASHNKKRRKTVLNHHHHQNQNADATLLHTSDCYPSCLAAVLLLHHTNHDGLLPVVAAACCPLPSTFCMARLILAVPVRCCKAQRGTLHVSSNADHPKPQIENRLEKCHHLPGGSASMPERFDTVCCA